MTLRTEDQVRDYAKLVLGFDEVEDVIEMRWNKTGKSITNRKRWNAWIPKLSEKNHTDDESRIALG